jgi:hypothetical protein
MANRMSDGSQGVGCHVGLVQHNPAPLADDKANSSRGSKAGKEVVAFDARIARSTRAAVPALPPGWSGIDIPLPSGILDAFRGSQPWHPAGDPPMSVLAGRLLLAATLPGSVEGYAHTISLPHVLQRAQPWNSISYSNQGRNKAC